MALINIKITKQAHLKLASLKERYEIKTFSLAIIKSCEFFEKTMFNPEFKNNESFTTLLKNLDEKNTNQIQNLKKDFLKDSQSFRKMIRVFHEKSLVSIAQDIYFIKNFLDENLKENSKKDSGNNTKDDEFESQKLLKEKMDLIDEKDKQIKELLEKNKSQLIEDHKNVLQKIRENYKLENNLLGKERIVLNIDSDNFYKLFKFLD